MSCQNQEIENLIGIRQLLKFNSTVKDNFKKLELEEFWVKYLPVYPFISTQALRVLVMFGSIYLCDDAFQH